jgi:hypothetical protein
LTPFLSPDAGMASFDGRKRGLLVAYDAMAVPGKAAALAADLLEEGFLRSSPLGGEVVLFEHAGRVLGRTLTGGDGRAVVSFTPTARGTMTVTVRMGESQRVTAPEANARIFVWDRRQPIVIVSMKALASVPRQPDQELPFPRSGARLQDPESGAVQALAAVARRAGLIYVTGQDRLDLPEARLWVDRNRLPAGPIFLLKPGPMSLAHELERWRGEGWTHIKGGLAGTAEEAKALVGKKLKAVLAPTAPAKEKWPDGAIATKDWKEVVRQFS